MTNSFFFNNYIIFTVELVFKHHQYNIFNFLYYYKLVRHYLFSGNKIKLMI